MKREDDSLLSPPLERLLAEIPQKYELVLAATRRAKQIIRERLLNPVSLREEDRQRKPLSIALADIVEGKVDQQVLMAPDIQFDDIEEESLELFAETGSLEESFAADTEETEDAEGEEPDPEDEGEDDLAEVDELFDLGSDQDDEASE
jgi:DNA-directed RNA polymerase omega subunit